MTNVRPDIRAFPVGDVTAVLGEGPYWVPDESCLLWVDIPSGQLHRTEIPSGKTVTADINQVSAVFPVQGGGLLYAAANRLVLRKPVPGQAGRSGEFTERTVASFPPRPDVRFNDASVDPAGRVWAGTMDTGETEPLGELYRLDPGGLTSAVTGVTVSNGLAWSPDGARLYYVDSPTRQVDEFDYDEATGMLSGRRILADLHDFDGVPDGLTIDSDGYLWVAMHDGGRLCRIAPLGTVDAVVPLPVSKPTSVAFGGPGMADLFVTTASRGLSPAELEAQPLAGRLLRLVPGPVGLPSTTAHALIQSLPLSAHGRWVSCNFNHTSPNILHLTRSSRLFRKGF